MVIITRTMFSPAAVWATWLQETHWMGLTRSQTQFQWTQSRIYLHTAKTLTRPSRKTIKATKPATYSQQSSKSITSVLSRCVSHIDVQNDEIQMWTHTFPASPLPQNPTIFLYSRLCTQPPSPSLRRLNISCGISKLRESLGCQSLIAASWKSKLQSWILLLFKTGCTIPVKGETHPKSKQNKCTWRVWPWGRCVWGFHKHTFFLLGASQCMKQHIWKVSTTLLKTHPGLRCCNSTPVCHSVH